MLEAFLAFLKVLPMIGGWVTSFQEYLHDKAVKDAQQAIDEGDKAQSGLAELDKAGRARDASDAALRADPDGLRSGSDVAARGPDGIS